MDGNQVAPQSGKRRTSICCAALDVSLSFLLVFSLFRPSSFWGTPPVHRPAWKEAFRRPLQSVSGTERSCSRRSQIFATASHDNRAISTIVAERPTLFLPHFLDASSERLKEIFVIIVCWHCLMCPRLSDCRWNIRGAILKDLWQLFNPAAVRERCFPKVPFYNPWPEQES